MSTLSLLADSTSSSTGNSWATYVILGAMIVLLIVFMVFSSRRNKKRQQEAEDLINAVKPGNKVKTIGGVCGIVVEVDTEENTFVLETGSETSGKCYMKFDRQAILQSDAVVEKSDKKEEKAKEDVAPEVPFEEAKDAPAETSADSPVEAASEEKDKEEK